LSKRLSPQQTLTQAGIRSINLISDGEKQELDDGSVIFGKTTFAKDDGTLGEVADVDFTATGYLTVIIFVKN
jgi:hypothetical protein